LAEEFPLPANASAQPLPHTPNLFTPFSHDSSLAFSVPFDHVSDFLKAVQEIPESAGGEDAVEGKKWVMKAARDSGLGFQKPLKVWFSDAWSSFVDLIKVSIHSMRQVFLRNV
jgi:hydroxymethylglutaryl-CoA reductase (NADPH)